MPVLRPDWNLEITAEDVLFAQAADAAVISRRSPRLLEVAHKVAEEAAKLIDPVILFREIPVTRIDKNKLQVDNYILSGPLIREHLHQAASVLVFICSIGMRLETQASLSSHDDITFSFALDSAGSFIVELLTNHAYRYFEEIYDQQGLKTSIPLNPGMIGWPLLEGQKEVFCVLEDNVPEISLSESGMMTPRKTVSTILGVGKNVNKAGSRCDYCSYHGRCYF